MRARSGRSERACRGAPSAEAARRGGTLKVATTADAEVLDPSSIFSDVELRLCEQLFNGLVSIDENLNIVPDIAEEWAVTNDATHFEFKLRRGVMFHHGRELTADDVIFTIERFKDTWVSYVVRDLDTLSALDDHTVRVTFKQPAAHFIGSMAPRWTGIVPRDVVEKVGKDAFKSAPVGTGAFRFTEHVPFQRTVTERNADYFREGLPYVDRIEWIPVQDESARSAQIISGTVDVDPWGAAQAAGQLQGGGRRGPRRRADLALRVRGPQLRARPVRPRRHAARGVDCDRPAGHRRSGAARRGRAAAGRTHRPLRASVLHESRHLCEHAGSRPGPRPRRRRPDSATAWRCRGSRRRAAASPTCWRSCSSSGPRSGSI